MLWNPLGLNEPAIKDLRRKRWQRLHRKTDFRKLKFEWIDLHTIRMAAVGRELGNNHGPSSKNRNTKGLINMWKALIVRLACINMHVLYYGYDGEWRSCVCRVRTACLCIERPFDWLKWNEKQMFLRCDLHFSWKCRNGATTPSTRWLFTGRLCAEHKGAWHSQSQSVIWIDMNGSDFKLRNTSDVMFAIQIRLAN